MGTDDFVGTILSIIHFSFSKGETIAAASIILLCKWEREVGAPIGLADDLYLKRMFFCILHKCSKYKINLSGNPTFFDKFYKMLEKDLVNAIETKTNDNDRIDNSIITFDSKMVEAIRVQLKSEFRIPDNLQIVNLNPDDWKFTDWSNIKGAIMTNISSNENIQINFPYHLETTLQVADSSKVPIENLKIKISYAAVRRIQKTCWDDAIKEGIGIFEKEIEECPQYIDAEVAIFKSIWRKKYGSASLSQNHWIWVYGFYLYDSSASEVIPDVQVNTAIAKAPKFSLKNAMTSRI